MADTAPDISLQDAFFEAVERLCEALDATTRVSSPPSLKQMGMMIGSLQFRARELSARWRSETCFDVSCSRLDQANYGALREWPLADAAWLESACAALGRSIASGDNIESRQALDALMKGLPPIQEEISRRIYQQDLAS